MTDELISTGARVGEYDAVITAKPDEPIFTLQGGDPFAAATVQHWADLARDAGRANEDPDERERLLKKASAAERVGWAMTEYLKGYTDQAAANRAEDKAVAADDKLARLARAADRIYNSIAELCDVVEAVRGDFPHVAISIVDAVHILQLDVAAIEPRRHLREKP